MGYFKEIGQYLLPWKAWKNMREDLSKATDIDGKNKHKSIYGAIGKYADPAGALMGDRWMDFWHERVPEKVNEKLEPVGHFNRKIDPIARMLPEDSKGQKIPDFVEAKGGDSLATVLALVFGGMAAGAGGAGGTGGAGGSTMSPYGPYASGYQFPTAGSAAPASSSAPASGGGMFSGYDFSAMDWQDPNTYMRLSQMAPKQQQQQQQPPPQRRGMMAQNTYKPQTIDQWLEYYGFNSKV